jgi:acetyl-CoA acetyltransferase family protein
MSRSVFIVQGARTPMCEYEGSKTGDGRPGGALGGVSAVDLGAIASREAMVRSGVSPDRIDQVIFGNAMQTAGDAIYGARHVGLKAGVPIPVPALTVNRLCGSGIQSVIGAAEQILLGEASVVLAGGMENMSQAPHVIRGARRGFRLGQGALEDSLMVALLDTHCGLYMAQTAEKLAARYGITREMQDLFALRSHTEATRAQKAGIFAEEIVPVEVPAGRGKTIRVESDDHMRTQTSLDQLAQLPPAFSKDGSVTAGNASGIVDGAAALVIAEESAAKSLGVEPLARLVSWAFVGVEPAEMGIGPAPAIRRALEKAELQLADLDLIEVNEAFAAQYLSVEKELGLDRDTVNVNGGAIALGHPLGASGTRLLLTLALEMRRRGARRGAASACIGGGQGIAMIIERP